VHGIIFDEFRNFVQTTHGATRAWDELLDQAGLGSRIYTTTETYPDAELLSLVSYEASRSRLPTADLLVAFGEAVVPGLVQVYGVLIDPRWKLMDVLEKTEDVIHRAVRLRDDRADPPQLHVRRVAEDEVVIIYASGRMLCSFARGLVLGLAEHYKEPVEIDETSCMLRRDHACRLSVTLTPG
jgi:hypothetical protein